MRVHMIKKYMYILSFIIMIPVLLAGCGKKDELVMITTEKHTGDTTENTDSNSNTPVTTSETLDNTSDVVTEEASPEEQKVTMADITAANSGDILLSGGKGVSASTIYYSAGTELYSENRFLGFGEDGQYMQAYEDVNGDIEVLDNYNQCWYVLSGGSVYTKLCPEDGVCARLIDYNHNHTIVDAYDSEEIKSVYRSDGKLVVETSYTDNAGATFTYKYYMAEGYLVDEIYCYAEDGDKISYERVTRDSVYNTPDELIDLLNGTAETRTIQVIYPDGDGLGNIYIVPKRYPVLLDLYQYKAYSDEDCSVPWGDSSLDADGNYVDSIIYLKK